MSLLEINSAASVKKGLLSDYEHLINTQGWRIVERELVGVPRASQVLEKNIPGNQTLLFGRWVSASGNTRLYIERYTELSGTQNTDVADRVSSFLKSEILPTNLLWPLFATALAMAQSQPSMPPRPEKM